MSLAYDFSINCKLIQFVTLVKDLQHICSLGSTLRSLYEQEIMNEVGHELI